MSAASIGIWVILAVLPVRLAADDCPSAVDVEEALAAVLSRHPAPAVPDLARVAHLDGKLRVELIDPDGVLIAERELEATGTCLEQAKLAALIIASWESDVHPEFARAHVEPPRTEPASVVRATYDVGLGGSVGKAAGIAPGAVLDGAWFPWGRGLGLSAGVAGEGERTIPIGDGEAAWRRFMGSTTLVWRVGAGRAAFDTRAGVAASWLRVRGTGFDRNTHADSTAIGALAGLRVSWWITPGVAVWADLRTFYLSRAESAYSSRDGSAPLEDGHIPRWGAVASAGLAFGRAPLSR